MIDKEKAKLNPKVQWAKFIIVAILYVLFLYWVGSWWGVIVLPFIYDVYITKKIRWQWWKDSEGLTRFLMSWVDAIVFALVAVYFINLFFFQNFVIPSSSLEKSLLTGDYLCVSKLSYGPRIPQTPLTMPLTQHTMPLIGCKSYIEWPQWEYRRVKGFGDVKLNDIVVFNYPAGDSILTEEQYQTMYYELAYKYGALEYLNKKGQLPSQEYDQLIYDPEFYPFLSSYTRLDSISPMEQRELFDEIYALGRNYLAAHPANYGRIDSRPTDRRENYVKRCVGLPGQTLQIKDRIVYLDGKANKEPENVQYTYNLKLRNTYLPEEMIDELGITQEEITQLSHFQVMPMTKKVYNALSRRSDLVESISINTDSPEGFLYPLNAYTGWTRDNYGPLWIPKKGQQIPGGLTLKNLPIYERLIKVYEGNSLEVRNGKILINGKEATNYTFKLNYYWMMGDNRHNSADSRYWGPVPEDHVVGKPLFIWWSSDPDRGGFRGIRWNRLFTWVDNIK